MTGLLLIAAAAGLFPLAPPNPAQLLSKVAELVLRTRLKTSGKVAVDVQDGGAMFVGRVNGVRVTGSDWITPLRLSCRQLDVSVGQTAIDFGALATQQKILLQKPSVGSAKITFTAEDWSNFLSHPLVK